MYELIDNNTGTLSEKASLEVATRLKLEAENKIFFERLKEERKRYAEETGDYTTYEDENIKLYYKKGYTQKRLDGSKLKQEIPELYEKYLKKSEVKSTFVLELKDGN